MLYIDLSSWSFHFVCDFYFQTQTSNGIMFHLVMGCWQITGTSRADFWLPFTMSVQLFTLSKNRNWIFNMFPDHCVTSIHGRSRRNMFTFMVFALMLFTSVSDVDSKKAAKCSVCKDIVENFHKVCIHGY